MTRFSSTTVHVKLVAIIKRVKNHNICSQTGQLSFEKIANPRTVTFRATDPRSGRSRSICLDTFIPKQTNHLVRNLLSVLRVSKLCGAFSG
jgi:hypothetical protein